MRHIPPFMDADQSKSLFVLYDILKWREKKLDQVTSCALFIASEAAKNWDRKIRRNNNKINRLNRL